MPSALQSSTRFEAEANMLQPLSAAANKLLKNPTVLFEVPTDAGTPDLVLLTFNREAHQQRIHTTPLLSQVDVRLMVSLSRLRKSLERSWSYDELSEYAGVSSQHLRRRIIPRLVEGGHLDKNSGGKISLQYRHNSLAKRVVTIEAKLRNWRHAVGQASRHTAAADAAWVALDSKTSKAAIKSPDWFTTYGIGLLSVRTDGKVRREISPGPSYAHRTKRELLVERAVALYEDGKASGGIPQVFGTTLLATIGVDPRLEGDGGC